MCSYFIEETLLGLKLVSPSYQSILQEKSRTIDLLSIQIDKYERMLGIHNSTLFLIFRICLGRHHVLDVAGGVALALVEYLVMNLIWLSPEAAEGWGKYLSFTEDPWSSA